MRIYLLWDVHTIDKKLKAVCYDFNQVELIVNNYPYPLHVEHVVTDTILTDDMFEVIPSRREHPLRGITKIVSSCNTILTLKDTMPFGKHKGKKMRELPLGYLQWLVDTVTIYEFGADIYSYISAHTERETLEPLNFRGEKVVYRDTTEKEWSPYGYSHQTEDRIQTIRNICTNAPREAMDMIYECDRLGEDVPDNLRNYTRLMVAECD